MFIQKLTTGVIGCIAGPDGCLVKLQDALKKPWPVIPPSSTIAQNSTTA